MRFVLRRGLLSLAGVLALMLIRGQTCASTRFLAASSGRLGPEWSRPHILDEASYLMMINEIVLADQVMRPHNPVRVTVVSILLVVALAAAAWGSAFACPKVASSLPAIRPRTSRMAPSGSARSFTRAADGKPTAWGGRRIGRLPASTS